MYQISDSGSLAGGAAAQSRRRGDDPALRDIIPVPLITIDGNRAVEEINPAAARLLGMEVDEALGKQCADILHCERCRDECALFIAREDGTLALSAPTVVSRSGPGSLQLLVDAVPLSGNRIGVVLHAIPEGTPIQPPSSRPSVFHGLVWVSDAMKQVVARVIEWAPGRSPILVSGEAGTETEAVAHAIHAEAGRSSAPFVAVDCTTDAVQVAAGTGSDTDPFHRAAGGTLFLRNLTSLSQKAQLGLLRRIEALRGSRRERAPRVIAEVTGDPQEAVRDGALLSDLFDVLASHHLHVPSLRDRCEDLPVVARQQLERMAARNGNDPLALTGDVTAALIAYNWPGNLDELRNVLDRAAAHAKGGVILRGDLPGELLPEGWVARSDKARTIEALRKAAGNISLAARMLGVHRITLWRRMRNLGLQRKDFLPR